MEIAKNSLDDRDKAIFNMFFKIQSQQQQHEIVDAEPKYSILNEAQIRQRQEDDIARVSAAISESRSSAIVLLRHFNWNLSKLFDHWFDNELQVRIEFGLFPSPIPRLPSDHATNTCGICFEAYSDDTNGVMASASCGHPFCTTCWSNYITKSINEDGIGCLLMTCPYPSCVAAVGEDMVEALAPNHSDKEKFSRFLLRSYIEDSYLRRKIKWCPAPDCSYAVDFTGYFVRDGLLRGRNFSVNCRCSHCFCWSCGKEDHSPVDCDAAAKWILKSNDESESTNWILVNTKACPKCKRPIEKSQGCNFMRCAALCNYEFCWHCLGAWTKSPYHACNRFKVEEDAIKTEETERIQAVKVSLSKHEHYYIRWAENLKLRQKAAEDLRVLQSEHLGKLGLKYGTRKDSLTFVIQAWEQIIRCRRVLQWSYVYGYYFPEDSIIEKKRFFEYLQGEAEYSLERLHECAEKELETYLNGEGSTQDFAAYRQKLSQLTFVIGSYFENLVKALEDGLPEVAQRRWSCEVCSFANLFGTKCYMCCSICPSIATL